MAAAPRPESFDAFIGQERAKSLLQVLVRAARSRSEPVGHLLMVSGYSGVGKTTLARIVAQEMGTRLVELVGCNIKDPDEIASVLSGLQPMDVLFIDELHGVPRAAEEVLYSAMEDRMITVVDRSYDQLMRNLGMVNPDAAPRTKTLTLPPFTLIGASTTEGELSPPLRSRFAQAIELRPYTIAELESIVLNAGTQLSFPVPRDIAHGIAQRSRSTARTAIGYLLFFRDYVQGTASEPTVSALDEAFAIQDVDDRGLTAKDRRYLRCLTASVSPVGLGTLAVALNESPATLQSSIEPYLVQSGLVRRTARGRIATDEAVALLKAKQ